MEQIYIYMVGILFVLAIADLVIGVSNDAVNFLNSSIGSKVASRKTIMLIASVGIFIGAAFSGGMMEVARKGIFNPDAFVFADIMIIFVAVMLTDIILLDFFNTFGLPTSTTVSIVFELLGAATALAIIKMMNTSGTTIVDYINTSNALEIVSGIFLSILIAFTIGLLVQYISRTLFSFHFEKRLTTVGVIFGAVALTAITYFILVKGIKGSTLVSGETIAWIKSNTILIIGIALGVWLVLSFIIQKIIKFNILKLVVLAGTFSLALAFASNDLVNFIGVPMAGLSSFETYSESSVAADSLSTSFLNNPVSTNNWLLIAAGLIMVCTLWFSKKAQSVTETEVNLGRQGPGQERFKPNSFSRGIVRFGIHVGNFFRSLIPKQWNASLEKRFEQKTDEARNAPAFDLVRASVNLTVAGILISIATSMALPLSTTYVSFMVAMGTSLADKAWDRDSAVFRVSGVIHVVGGWFMTALIAFSAAMCFAFLLYNFEIYALISLVVIALGLLLKNQITHKKQAQEKSDIPELSKLSNPSKSLLYQATKEDLVKVIFNIRKNYAIAIEGISSNDRKQVKSALKRKNSTIKKIEQINKIFLYHSKKFRSDSRGIHIFVTVLGRLQNLGQSIELIVNSTYRYVENQHTPLQSSQVKAIRELQSTLDDLLLKLEQHITADNAAGIKNLVKDKKAAIHKIESNLSADILQSKAAPSNQKEYLIVSLFMETIDLIEDSLILSEYYLQKIEKYQDKAEIQKKEKPSEGSVAFT